MLTDYKYGILVHTNTQLEPNKVIRYFEQVPNIMERHIIPRPIQQVYIETIEEPWRLMALEKERKYVQLTLQLQNKQYKNEQVNTQDYNDNDLELEIEKLEQLLKLQDEEYNDKLKLFQQLQIQETKIESSNYSEQQELEQIKQKFKVLNDKYHANTEKIGFLEVQIESMKNQAVQIKKSVVAVTKSIFPS